MGYNIAERSSKIQYISSKRWESRKNGSLYDILEDQDLPDEFYGKYWNPCKNQPKSMVKYINMQTTLCPVCKTKNISARCNNVHLETIHNIEIADAYEIIQAVQILNDKLKNKKKNKKGEKNSEKLKRKDILEFADKN